jgi:hypothetical protein
MVSVDNIELNVTFSTHNGYFAISFTIKQVETRKASNQGYSCKNASTHHIASKTHEVIEYFITDEVDCKMNFPPRC